MFEQINQDAEGLLAHLDGRTAPAQLLSSGVHLKDTKAPDLACVRRRCHGISPALPLVVESSTAPATAPADTPKSIDLFKPLFIKNIGRNTQLISELPPVHGAKCGVSAKFETSQASAGHRRSQIQKRRTTMTARIANLSNLIFSLSLATGLLCAGANASAQSTASVTIPFAFSADHQYVPAGSYKVQLLSDRFLSLRNEKTNETQVLMVRPEAGQVIETRGRLTFHREGNRNYLAQVWIAGSSLHSEIAVQHKPEREIAKANTAPSTIELALK
jgi:hypothetical protein